MYTGLHFILRGVCKAQIIIPILEAMKWGFREVRMFVQLDLNLGLSGSNILLLPWCQLPPTEGRGMESDVHVI